MKEERQDYDLLNDLPNIYELEDMMAFCKKFENIFIYGRAWNQEHLLKYFDDIGIKIAGFVVTKKQECDDDNFAYRKTSVFEIDEIMSMKSTGIILGLSEKYYGQIIPMFRANNFENYFILTDYTKGAIAGQMRKRSKRVLGFEVSLADHCNLSCQMCDHFSQLSEPSFVDIDVFERDIIQMAKLYDHECGPITLLGGEPTLHADIIKCVRIVRREFPNAVLGIMTNGLLLLDCENSEGGNLWQVCKDLNVRIEVTVYPIKLDYAAIEKKAEEYDIDLIMSSNIHAEELTRVVKISDKHTLRLNGDVDDFYFVNCLYFNKFNVLKDGKLYMCPIEAHIDIFNKKFNKNIEYADGAFLDIYNLTSWEEIREWTSHRIPFCSYCDQKDWGPRAEWKASTKSIEEYV